MPDRIAARFSGTPAGLSQFTSNSVQVKVDSTQLKELADIVGRTAHQIEDNAGKLAKRVAEDFLDYVRDETPVYEGDSADIEKGALRDAWKIDSEWNASRIGKGGKKTTYRIWPPGNSMDKTQWATEWVDIVQYIEGGTATHTIPPRHADKLLWMEKDEGGELESYKSVQSHTPKNAFLDRAFDKGWNSGTMDRVIYDMVFAPIEAALRAIKPSWGK